MANIEKIIESINIPKKAVDGAEAVLKKLFGPAITETGELIADQVRFRRFKNQVKIFSKTQELLASNSIEAKQINLKVLSPLIEYTSLEEDEQIQVIWANVIANIASYDTEQSLNLKCIEVLKEITPDEILILDVFFEKFNTEEKISLEKWKDSTIPFLKAKTKVFADNSVFAPWDYKEQLKIEQEKLDLYIDRLISFGILKYEQPILNKSKERIFTSRRSSKIIKDKVDIYSYELESSQRVHFTTFGIYFVKICKYLT